LAGFYDKNKKIIKPVAAGLAGMLGTPALGAAVGAAFGGLDREGKKGIGLDLGGAAKGGLAGYAAGSAGQSLGKLAGIGKVGALEKAGQGLSGGLKSMLTGSKAAAPGAEGLQRGTAMMNKGMGMMDGAGAASAASAPMGAGGGSSISNLLSGAGKAANKVGGFVERNKGISELGVKGLLSQLPDEESAIARQRLDLDERKFDMTEQQIEEERERRRYVMQYLLQQYPQYFQNG
jgi:hypothetical protein